MTIPQGTILPATGIGTGYILLIIYYLTAWKIGIVATLQIPFANMLLLIFALMQFSYKDFIVDFGNPSYFTIQYRILFFIPFTRVKKFSQYDVFVIKVVNKSYNVKQSGTGGLVSGKNQEHYLAIIGREEIGKENVEICKGNKDQLDFIIKDFIMPLDIPVYRGARKRGYEYEP